MEGEVSHRVLQGSVLAAIQLRIYSMIQRMHIKFSDSMNPRGNKSTAEVKIFSTKKEINFVGKWGGGGKYQQECTPSWTK